MFKRTFKFETLEIGTNKLHLFDSKTRKFYSKSSINPSNFIIFGLRLGHKNTYKKYYLSFEWKLISNISGPILVLHEPSPWTQYSSRPSLHFKEPAHTFKSKENQLTRSIEDEFVKIESSQKLSVNLLKIRDFYKASMVAGCLDQSQNTNAHVSYLLPKKMLQPLDQDSSIQATRNLYKLRRGALFHSHPTTFFFLLVLQNYHLPSRSVGLHVENKRKCKPSSCSLISPSSSF